MNCLYQKNMNSACIDIEFLVNTFLTSCTWLCTGAIVDEMLKPKNLIRHVVNAEFLGATQLGDHLFESFKKNMNEVVKNATAEELAKLPGTFTAEAMKAMLKVLEQNEELKRQNRALEEYEEEEDDDDGNDHEEDNLLKAKNDTLKKEVDFLASLVSTYLSRKLQVYRHCAKIALYPNASGGRPFALRS